MSEECNHNCGSCGKECGERDLHEKLNEKSSVKKVIGVVSGKGGVGKTLVTALLTAAMQKKRYRAAVLDADITGPSIPKIFGVSEERATGTENTLFPVCTSSGIQLMSMNFLLPDATDPVIWRGPIIAGAVKQFWTDVIWDSVDFMFVDMPPGTGDVPLTVFQSIAIDGILIVASPQELVSLIVEKAVKMANMMHIPVLGLIENMSYVRCPHCNEQIKLFGESNIGHIASDYNLPVLAHIPIDPALATACDTGSIEQYDSSSFLSEAAASIEKLLS